MQACARIGAIHSVVFGGFSAKSVQERIVNGGAKVVITADEQVRGGRKIPLKAAVDEALAMGCETVEKVVVYQRTGADVAMAKAAGIKNEAVLVGLLDRFEIWSPDRYVKVTAADEVLAQEAFKLME